MPGRAGALTPASAGPPGRSSDYHTAYNEEHEHMAELVDRLTELQDRVSELRDFL